MVKSLPNVFTLILTKIVNVSLASFQFRTPHKHALVTLQHVQDTAGTGRLLCVAYAWTHTPPFLPVSNRIQFKVCTLMFVINHGTAPQYLSELVRHCERRHLASVQCAWQLCSFMYAAPCNWQSLFYRWAMCLECTGVWHETDLIKKLKTLFLSHLMETFISF